jgi:molecular chaperone GrpE
MSHRRIPVSNDDRAPASASPASAPEAEPRANAGEGAPGPGRGADPEEAVPRSDRARAGQGGRDGRGRSAEEAAASSAGEEPGAIETPAPAESVLRDQLLRLAAEFDNFRKRQTRERAEAWSRAKADLVEKLLPALDDLHRVAHPEAAEAPVRALLEGVELVERKLLQVLEREGLEPIEAEGAAFDPSIHEAILTQPTDDPALDGRVAHVAVPGWRFADRLLRPARVVVWTLSR